MALKFAVLELVMKISAKLECLGRKMCDGHFCPFWWTISYTTISDGKCSKFLFLTVENVRRKFHCLFLLENLRRVVSLVWKICDDWFLFVGKCQTVTSSPMVSFYQLENVRRSQIVIWWVCTWWKMSDGHKKSIFEFLFDGKCQMVIKKPHWLVFIWWKMSHSHK